MIGDDEHGLVAKPQPFELHRGGDHGEGLPGANSVRQHGITVLDDPLHGVFLVRHQLDILVHPRESHITAVIFLFNDIIESIVVQTLNSVSAVKIFIQPLIENDFDFFLLGLSSDGFITVCYISGFSVRCFLFAGDLYRNKIQAAFEKLIS